MNGRVAIHSHCQRIEQAFERAKDVDDPELLSDYAKYLCVLVSGFIEKAIAEVIIEYSRTVSAPSVQKFVEGNLIRFTNAKMERILNLLGSFDSDWRAKIAEQLDDESKGAIDSVISLRHKIVHGGSVGLTYSQIKTYFNRAKSVVEKIEDTCLPMN